MVRVHSPRRVCICPVRLVVRTSGFQPEDGSSILPRGTNIFENIVGSSSGRTSDFGSENGGSNPSPTTFLLITNATCIFIRY